MVLEARCFQVPRSINIRGAVVLHPHQLIIELSTNRALQAVNLLTINDVILQPRGRFKLFVVLSCPLVNASYIQNPSVVCISLLELDRLCFEVMELKRASTFTPSKVFVNLPLSKWTAIRNSTLPATFSDNFCDQPFCLGKAWHVWGHYSERQPTRPLL